MKILIIETATCTPHTETSIEIGLKHKLAGDDVVYAPIFHLVLDSFWNSNIKGDISRPIDDGCDIWLKYVIELTKNFFHLELIDATTVQNLLDSIPNELTYQNLISSGIDKFLNTVNLKEITDSNLVQRHNSIDLNSIYKNHPNDAPIIAHNVVFSYFLSSYLIDKHSPDLVVFFNGRTTTSFPIYSLCKELNIKPLIHERGSSMDRYATYDSPVVYHDAHIEAIKKFQKGRDRISARNSAATYYYRLKNGKLKTFQAFNKQDHSIIKLPYNLESRNFSLYFTSSNDEILTMGSENIDIGLGSQFDAMQSLAKVCNSIEMPLVIRMHPRTGAFESMQYKNILSKFNQIYFIEGNDPLSSYLLATEAAHNFSAGSTITFELNYNMINCAILCKSLGHGFEGVAELQSEQAIFDYLNQVNHIVSNDFAITYGDYMHNFGEIYDFYVPTTGFSGSIEFDLKAADNLVYSLSNVS
jgi:hypothetical protein